MSSHPPDLLALLKAAKASPDDDSLRLIIADWLDDHGQHDRADCVRLSLRYAALELDEETMGDDPRRHAWSDELNDPTREAGRWLVPLRRILPKVEWYRGLLRVWADDDKLLLARSPDSIPLEFLPWLETLGLPPCGTLHELALRGWLRHFTAVQCWHFYDSGGPTSVARGKHLAHVTRLELGVRPDAVGEIVAAADHFPALRSLKSEIPITQAEVEALANSPLLGRLTSLNVRNHDTDPVDLSPLFASPHAAGLTRLMVRASLGLASAHALARSPNLGRLRSLCFYQFQDNGAVRSLAEWPADRPLDKFCIRFENADRVDDPARLGQSAALRSLSELWINGRVVNRDILAAMLAGVGSKLHRLRLAFCDLAGAGEVLAGCANLAGLRELGLHCCRLTQEDMFALVRSPHLRNLETLILHWNKIGLPGIRALVIGTPNRRPGKDAVVPFPNLRVLDLSSTHLTRACAGVLARSPLLAHLEILDLSRNDLYPSGAAALAETPAIAALRHLRLNQCRVGDKGIEALAASPHLSELRTLGLDSNEITAAGAIALAGSSGLGALVGMSLWDNQIDTDAAWALTNWRSGQWASFNIDDNPMGSYVSSAIRSKLISRLEGLPD